MKHNNWTPETAPKGKGRGSKKYCYTVIDIVRMTGRSLQTIRNDIHQNKLNMKDIISVGEYLKKYQKKELKEELDV